MSSGGAAAHPPDDDALEARRRRAWRAVVGVQALAVALVVVAVAAVWLVGLFGDLYGSR